MIVGPIRLYAQDVGDDEWEIRQCVEAGLSRRVAEAFVARQPLYEVAFDFMVHSDTGEAFCIKVALPGEVLTKPYPGQQLSLLEG